MSSTDLRAVNMYAMFILIQPFEQFHGHRQNCKVYKNKGESTECTITPVYKEKELMEERVENVL